jgi:hypothetical protein
MTKRIKGYWVISVDARGTQDIQNGSPMSAYYGYAGESGDREITIDGLILRGTRSDADSLARSFTETWAEQGADYRYAVRPLTDSDYFGAFHDSVEDFVGRSIA